MSKVRRHIELDDDHVRAIMDRYGLQTATEAVALTLRHLAGEPMTRDQVLAMRGAHAMAKAPGDVPPRAME